MELTIQQLKLRNFKGVKELTLMFNGKDAIIEGDNRTGKTTVVNAWLWLLFGKDWQGRADYEIKPHGKSKVEVEVEATVDIDGEELKIRRVYREVWTKKRGSNKESFSRHTTEYYLNDIPVKKSEYEQKLKTIANETLFRTLTDVKYFNEQLKWQDKRKMLLVLVGGSEAEAELKQVSDMQKKLKLEMRKINERIKEIPARIDELSKNIKEVEGYNKEEYEKRKKELEKLRDELKGKISQLPEFSYSSPERLKKDKKEILRAIKEVKETLEQEAVFDVEGEICKVCGQRLPEEQIEKAKEEFEQRRQKEKEKLQKELNRLEEHLQRIEKEIKKAKDFEEIKAKREELKEKLQKVESKLVDVYLAMTEAESQIKHNKKLKEAIIELEKQEKKLAREYEEREYVLFEAEEKIKGLASSIEDNINSQFQLVRFKLFEKQINEGIKETCEATLNGIPYYSLSNSERILAGLDIIRTLQKHYSLYLPVFVDNRESITSIPFEMECQRIDLIVKPWKELKIIPIGG